MQAGGNAFGKFDNDPESKTATETNHGPFQFGIILGNELRISRSQAMNAGQANHRKSTEDLTIKRAAL